MTARGHWILKTEPSTYSYDDLAREKAAVWDGVKNPVALRNLRAMRPGDRAIIYHTGEEKACVGLAEITSAGYTDPKKGEPLVVVDIKAAGKLARRGEDVRRLGPGARAAAVRGAVLTRAIRAAARDGALGRPVTRSAAPPRGPPASRGGRESESR
jgi:hypothetical protein